MEAGERGTSIEIFQVIIDDGNRYSEAGRRKGLNLWQ